MGCDNPPPAGANHRLQLSVSSNGSNGLRHVAQRQLLPVQRAFSILERIEWAATGVRHSRGRGLRYFQYPRTDRMGCDTALDRPGAQTGRRFQYPRTDRMGCDRTMSSG